MAERTAGGYWVGFDLGATKMMAVVFDPDFKIVGRRRRKTKSGNDGEEGVDRIRETIVQALEEARVEPRQIAGIGFGTPGPLNIAKGIILATPNLGWKALPLKQLIQKEFGQPVAVLNDVDAGTYGEYRFGAGQGARCVLGVFPGTGIGGGCVYEGRVLTGRTLSCVEIGHMQLMPNGPLCGCGQRGCLEALASRLAIAQAAAAAAARGTAPFLLKEAGTDIANIRSSVLAQSIAAGDKAVEAIVREAARWLGVGIANAVNLLSPDVVVLGGGLVEAMPELFMEEADRTSHARVMPAFRDTFKLATAKLGDDATATGAAAWARDSLDQRQA